MRYMMIHYIDESAIMDENGVGIEDAEFDTEIEAWDTEMLARGILVGGGRLRPISATTTMRVRDGELLVTDGPFAETKEQIAGYGILECADLDEAIEVSARHPTAKIGTFELRPYWD
jgi:hypothetical protein